MLCGCQGNGGLISVSFLLKRLSARIYYPFADIGEVCWVFILQHSAGKDPEWLQEIII